MLEIKHLSYAAKDEKGEKDILKDISLTIEPGKLMVITGPNGGGKTTLAKAIMGLIPTSSGQIIWKGEDITGCSITERANKGIGFGFQQPPRFKGLKVRDLLAIAAGHNLTLDESCEYLNQVGLCSKDYLDRDVDNALSGGEVKRIEIATVLARGGDLLIFDEPEAGIDLWSFSRLTETFQEIHKNTDAAMVIISHQERIIRLADEIVLVADGQIEKAGALADVFPSIAQESENTICTCGARRN